MTAKFWSTKMALTKAQRARIEGYDRNNRKAASIILADIQKYGGEGSGTVQWASLVKSKDPLWCDYQRAIELDDERDRRHAKKKTAESVSSQPLLFGLK